MATVNAYQLNLFALLDSPLAKSIGDSLWQHSLLESKHLSISQRMLVCIKVSRCVSRHIPTPTEFAFAVRATSCD